MAPLVSSPRATRRFNGSVLIAAAVLVFVYFVKLSPNTDGSASPRQLKGLALSPCPVSNDGGIEQPKVFKENNTIDREVLLGLVHKVRVDGFECSTHVEWRKWWHACHAAGSVVSSALLCCVYCA